MFGWLKKDPEKEEFEKIAKLRNAGILCGKVLDQKPYEQEPDKVLVYYNSIADELIIRLNLAVRNIPIVFHSRENEILSYRPGNWEEYLMNELFPRAQQKQAEKFSPIDDSKLFRS